MKTPSSNIHSIGPLYADDLHPSEDKIQISSQSYPYEYIIYSTNGIVMKKGCVYNENDEIEVLNLKSGFYVIENIELHEKIVFTKFK